MQLAIQKNVSYQLLLKKFLKQSVLLMLLVAGLGTKSFAQPANDDPCNAIPLVAGPTCNYITFSNENATTTAGVPDPTCGVFGWNGGDVWFQVPVTPASGGTLTIQLEAGVVTDATMAVYSGTCTSLTQIGCDDDSGPGLMPLITLTSLPIGSTIWVRVWEYGNNNNGTFGICIKHPGPPPAYDDPCNAVPLPTPTTDCTYQTFTNDGATSSAGVPAPGCANYQGNDVWFQVVVPAGGVLNFDTEDADVTNGGMAIYSGTCDNLTLIACDDNTSQNGDMPQIVASSLTPGSTVWIRFWSNTFNANVGTFGICVSIPPPAPANDDPCGAITINATNFCNFQTYTTASATPSSSVPPPTTGCGGYAGGDVWFKVIVPCEGSLNFNTQPGVITDAVMALYTGPDCNNLTEIDCDDDGGDGLMPAITSTTLTPGSTVWIRIYEYGNDNPGTFGLCVSTPPLCPSLSAQPFCSSNVYTFPNSVGVPSLGGQGIYDCLLTTPNPAWYYMQVQNTGPITIHIVQDNPGPDDDVDFCLWGPFTDLSNSCNGLSADNVVDCSYSSSETEDADIPNAIAGQYYILLLTNYSDEPGQITFNQSAGTGSTSCDVLCELTSGNSGPICSGSTVNLTANTIPGANYQWNGALCFSQTPLSTEQNPMNVPVPSEPGMYIFTVIASTPGGSACSSIDTVYVIAGPVIGNDTTVNVCKGGTYDLTPLYNTTGLTSSQWVFQPTGAVVANPASVSAAGIYQLIGTNATGCTDTVRVTVLSDTVRATATGTALGSCSTPGTITVTDPTGVGSIFEYSISTAPSVFQLANTFTADPADYTILVRDSLGCISDPIPVTVGFTNDLVLNAITPANPTICQGQSVTLTTSGTTGATYTWSPGTGLSTTTGTTTVASPVENQVYTVTSTLGACEQQATVSVNVDKNLTVEAGGPLSLDPGSTAQLNAIVTGTNTTLTSIAWTPAAEFSAANILNPVLTPVGTSGTATYNITVENSAGCTASDQLIVNIVSSGCRNVRNAFTPNGDGINDVWLVYDDFSCLTNVSVQVFNRYGSKVYESSNYRNTWTGNYGSKALPDGTYYAVVQFTLLSKRVITVKSDVTILR